MPSRGENEGFTVLEEFVCQAIPVDDSGDASLSPEVSSGEERGAANNTRGSEFAEESPDPRKNEP